MSPRVWWAWHETGSLNRHMLGLQSTVTRLYASDGLPSRDPFF